MESMDPSEWMGFFISLLAFLVLIVNMARKERARQRDPESYSEIEKEKERRLREFFEDPLRERSSQGNNEEDEDEEQEDWYVEPLPPPLPVVKSQPTSPLPASPPLPKHILQDKHSYVSQHYLRMTAYHQLSEEADSSRLNTLIESLPSKKTLIILHEVLEPPISLR